MLILLGNAMAFAGIPNAKDRADLISYLKEKKAV
jgi:cytochrome c2